MADTSSRRCASSTPTTTPPLAPGINASIALRTRRAGSAPTSPSIGANAPSGRERADRVAAAQCVRAPRRAAIRKASRANRVLPTPGAPASTIPPPPARRPTASATNSIACARPVSGHPSATRQA